jgi:WXXGXW repeat (2 copies)
MVRKILPPLLAALAFCAAPTFAQFTESATITDRAPPDMPPQSAPAEREGYVWAPGYYAWRNNDYVWVDGRYERARPGYRYESPRWVEENGRYRYVDESWIFDEDRTYGRQMNETSRTR